ncbi:MAG: hypothetical protein JO228_03045 [Xanthobacteraceae bacterium]|nr:hypothetical protein [Xanthobacteraceae bacterium]
MTPLISTRFSSASPAHVGPPQAPEKPAEFGQLAYDLEELRVAVRSQSNGGPLQAAVLLANSLRDLVAMHREGVQNA